MSPSTKLGAIEYLQRGLVRVYRRKTDAPQASRGTPRHGLDWERQRSSGLEGL